jgi:hypothetical protein
MEEDGRRRGQLSSELCGEALLAFGADPPRLFTLGRLAERQDDTAEVRAGGSGPLLAIAASFLIFSHCAGTRLAGRHRLRLASAALTCDRLVCLAVPRDGTHRERDSAPSAGARPA